MHVYQCYIFMCNYIYLFYEYAYRWIDVYVYMCVYVCAFEIDLVDK